MKSISSSKSFTALLLLCLPAVEPGSCRAPRWVPTLINSVKMIRGTFSWGGVIASVHSRNFCSSNTCSTPAADLQADLQLLSSLSSNRTPAALIPLVQ
ncbi:hypothetical protein EYF80_065611 [Liparis tanakae]|uniref:Uncharacterized protein n=1 Tax=Liparis tanakae TaxID=230148 RepID=A0A4Z2E5R6_9TELE|nr:hypothetical protein EYF80_065611 [Liparis tanakae]